MRRALFLAACAFAAPAFAQGDEIVVTGERRAQSTTTLAGNAAALTGADLAFIGAQGPSEALNRLPGVAIHRNNGVENLPAIRSPVLNGGQSAGSFLVLEDGVPIRAPGFANVNQLFETSLDFADRVEVVRGPGSSLYGSNAVHGLVNVITPTPGRLGWACSVAEAHAFAIEHASIDIGSFGRVGGALTAIGGYRGGHHCPHTDSDGQFEMLYVTPTRHRFNLSFAATHEDGWRDASGLDRQQLLGGWDAHLGEWVIETRLAVQNLNQETAGFIEGPDAYANSALARTNPVPEAYRDTQLARARVTLTRDFGDWSVRLTPYARWIDADLNLSFFPSRAQELTRQTGGGLQASLYWDPRDDFSLILGADGDWTDGSLYEFQTRATTGSFTQGLHYDYDVAMRVAALYAQANWAFAEDWRLVAGLRGEEVRYDYDNQAPTDDVGRFRRVADRVDDFSALTPRLGLVWTPSDAHTLWLNLARGARPPQITDLYSLQTTQVPGAQGVETLDSVELGWRGALGAASFEIALYHMDKRDTSFRNADGFTVSDGRTRHQGVEIAGIVPLADEWKIAGWLTYARHTYRFNDPSTRAGESISVGDDVDSAPRWLWNARTVWRPHEAVEAELEWVHMGDYFTNAANTRVYPGHDVFNLRADWRVSEVVSLNAAIRNLTNTDYAERADFAFGADRYFPGEDRGVTIGLRARR